MDIIVAILLIIGTVFIFLASIGLLRMPDVYLRMSASAIAATFGVASMLLAAALHFMELGLTLHIIGLIILLVLTVPIGAHMLGRTSHVIGLSMWKKTVCDDLAGKYNIETNDFDSPDTEHEDNNDSKDNQKETE